jgi:hypothetical protein
LSDDLEGLVDVLGLVGVVDEPFFVGEDAVAIEVVE